MWRSSAALLALWPLAAQLSDRQLARDIFKQLIEINTTDSAGDNTRAAEAIGPISRSRISGERYPRARAGAAKRQPGRAASRRGRGAAYSL